jgi:hypothetical protein
MLADLRHLRAVDTIVVSGDIADDGSPEVPLRPAVAHLVCRQAAGRERLQALGDPVQVVGRISEGREGGGVDGGHAQLRPAVPVRLLARCPGLAAADPLVRDFGGILSTRAGQHLKDWVISERAENLPGSRSSANGCFSRPSGDWAAQTVTGGERQRARSTSAPEEAAAGLRGRLVRSAGHCSQLASSLGRVVVRPVRKLRMAR